MRPGIWCALPGPCSATHLVHSGNRVMSQTPSNPSLEHAMIPRNARLALLVPLAAISLFACGPSSTASLTSREEALTSGPPSLGAAASFAVLAGTAVTCTNGTITGDVGVYPGTAITQTSCPVTGTLHA